MKSNQYGFVFLFLALNVSCITTSEQKKSVIKSDIEIVTAIDSAVPGTTVYRGKIAIPLSKGSIREGDLFPAIDFIDSTGIAQSLSGPGEVRLISVVPSIKTKECEIQSHRLAESRSVHPRVRRITISMDPPADLSRFATSAKISNVLFLSDLKTGDFGLQTGLLMTEKNQLARAVIVVNSQGVVQYLQLVPDITQLPDIDSAIAMANGMVEARKLPVSPIAK